MTKQIYKCLFLLSMAAFMQGCATEVYHASAAKQASINVDIPYKYQGGTSVLVVKDEDHQSDVKLLYGNYLPGSIYGASQQENHISVDANKKLLLRVIYPISYSQYCDINGSFTPEAGQKYWLSVTTEAPPEQGFVKTLLFGEAKYKCYFGVERYVDDKLEPVKLTDF